MISAIVLAAGRASRMGQPKQLLEIGGQPLVRRAAETALASPVGEVIVVVGQAADEVTAALAGLLVRVVHNPRYAEGMSTSLRAGVAALAPDSEAVVVLLGDQPFVTPEVVATLIQRYRDTGARVAIPVAGGRRGNPVLFDNFLYPELLEVSGDVGAREVVARHAGDIVLVEIQDARLHLDVDTPEEYAAVKALLERERAGADG